jgi:fructuronate reductase
MRYVLGVDEQGKPIDLRDPMSARLLDLAQAAGPNAERLAPVLLEVREIFGEDLARDPRFAAAVAEALRGLLAKGARRVVEEGAPG